MKNLNYTIHGTNDILKKAILDIKTNLYGYESDNVNSIKLSINNIDTSILSQSNSRYKLAFKIVNRFLIQERSHELKTSIVSNINKYRKALNERNESNFFEGSFFNRKNISLVEYIDFSNFTKNTNYSLGKNLLYLNVYLLDEEKTIISHKSNVEINLENLESENGDPFISYIKNDNNTILSDLINIRNNINFISLEENNSSLVKVNNNSISRFENVYIPSFGSSSYDEYENANTNIIDFFNYFDVSIIILDRKLPMLGYTSIDTSNTYSKFICKLSISSILSENKYFKKIDNNFSIENLNDINLNFLNSYIENVDNINTLQGKKFFAYLTYSSNLINNNVYFENRIIKSSASSSNFYTELFVNNLNMYRFIFEILNKSNFTKFATIDTLKIKTKNNKFKEYFEGVVKVNHIEVNSKLEFYNNFPFLKSLDNFYIFMEKISRDNNLKMFLPDFNINTDRNHHVLLYNSNNVVLYDSKKSMSREENVQLFIFILLKILKNGETNKIVSFDNYNIDQEDSITFEFSLKYRYNFLNNKYKNQTLSYSYRSNIENDVSSRFSFIRSLNNKEVSGFLEQPFTNNNRTISFNLNLGRKNFYNYKKMFNYDDTEDVFEFIKSFIVLVKGSITVKSRLNNRQLSKYQFYNVINIENYLQESNSWDTFKNVKIDLLDNDFLRYNPYMNDTDSSREAIEYYNMNRNINKFISDINENNLITLNYFEYSICALNKLSYNSLYNENISKEEINQIIHEFAGLAREKNSSISQSHIEEVVNRIYINSDIEKIEDRIFIYNTFKNYVSLTNNISEII